MLIGKTVVTSEEVGSGAWDRAWRLWALKDLLLLVGGGCTETAVM